MSIDFPLPPFQSVIGNIVAFRVHAPCSGAFLLDIFANVVTPQEYLTGEPMKFKSVCKFKVSGKWNKYESG